MVKDWTEQSRYQMQMRQKSKDMIQAVKGTQVKEFSNVYKSSGCRRYRRGGTFFFSNSSVIASPWRLRFGTISPTPEWRLVIASSTVIRSVPMAAYARVQRALQTLQLSRLTLSDITLISPASEDFQNLRACFQRPDV